MFRFECLLLTFDCRVFHLSAGGVSLGCGGFSVPFALVAGLDVFAFGNGPRGNRVFLFALSLSIFALFFCVCSVVVALVCLRAFLVTFIRLRFICYIVVDCCVLIRLIL